MHLGVPPEITALQLPLSHMSRDIGLNMASIRTPCVSALSHKPPELHAQREIARVSWLHVDGGNASSGRRDAVLRSSRTTWLLSQRILCRNMPWRKGKRGVVVEGPSLSRLGGRPSQPSKLVGEALYLRNTNPHHVTALAVVTRRRGDRTESRCLCERPLP